MTRMSVTARVTRNRVAQKFSRARKRLNLNASNAVNQLGEVGKLWAKAHAPRDKGNLANLIKLFKSSPQVPQAKVVSQNSTRNDHKRSRPFNLPVWIHTTARARGYFHSAADPRYMFRMRDYLNKIKRKTATGTIKKGMTIK